MSTSVIEPGARLAGRYRLEVRANETSGSTLWKATDETLARAVSVLTFAPGFPRIGEVVTAARAASRLTDPRLTQVFDADDSGERAYVVSEWVNGETLEELLAHGPIEPERAAALLLDAAEALTSAHRAGLAHLCLTPRSLVWTTGGTVKITGLGVDAVLSTATSEDPALGDTHGLARLLYAAVTAHWPGGMETTLPLAPADEGEPRAPRQVSASVPYGVDSIVCRALHLRRQHNDGPPITDPAGFADALTAVPRAPLLFMPTTGSAPPAVFPRPPETTAPGPAVPPVAPPARPPFDGRGTTGRHGSPDPRGGNRAVIALVVIVVLIVVGVGGWQLSKIGADDPEKTTSPSPSSAPSVGPLKPASAKGYDPGKQHPDTTIPKSPGNAIDGKSSTRWGSQHYSDAGFGGLKKGFGLLIDMGHPVKVSKVKVAMPSGEGGSLKLHVGDSADTGTPVAASTDDAIGTFELTPRSPVSGRYVLLWFDELPKINGMYRVKVSDVTVYGTG